MPGSVLFVPEFQHSCQSHSRISRNLKKFKMRQETQDNNETNRNSGEILRK